VAARRQMSLCNDRVSGPAGHEPCQVKRSSTSRAITHELAAHAKSASRQPVHGGPRSAAGGPGPSSAFRNATKSACSSLDRWRGTAEHGNDLATDDIPQRDASRAPRRFRFRDASSPCFQRSHGSYAQQLPGRNKRAQVRFVSGPAHLLGLPKVVRGSPKRLRIETSRLLCEFLLFVLSV
jgi:hypothetical protein